MYQFRFDTRLLFCGLLACLMCGCGTTEESRQMPTDPHETVEAHPPANSGFETKTDTVFTQRLRRPDDTKTASPPPEIRFMVQIGAFKDPQNATTVQNAARERYKLPVVNDYNAGMALYQIRIGFFETRESAVAFRQRLVKDFPRDYGDSWIVQLKR